jgi:hypothetical protein
MDGLELLLALASVASGTVGANLLKEALPRMREELAALAVRLTKPSKRRKAAATGAGRRDPEDGDGLPTGERKTERQPEDFPTRLETITLKNTSASVRNILFTLALAVVAVAVAWIGQNLFYFWEWLKETWPRVAPILPFILLAIGVCLGQMAFWLRYVAPRTYGSAEMVVAMIGMYFAAFSPDIWPMALSFAGAVYVFVRGRDNFARGQVEAKKRKFLRTFASGSASIAPLPIPPSSGGVGGGASVDGHDSHAQGGAGGKGATGTGGRGGNAKVKGDRSKAVGGRGGNA